MIIKRRRVKQTQSLEERLARDTAQLREQAKMLPPGRVRENVMHRIRQNEAASHFCELLHSPGLSPPAAAPTPRSPR
jgi:hypothetical protein